MSGVGSSIAGRSVSIVGLRVALYLATFLTSVLVSRVLGPEGRGEYYLPFLGATALVTVSKLGLDFGGIYLYSQRGYTLGALWRIFRRLAWIVGCVSSVLLLLSPYLLPGVFQGTPVLLLSLAAATILPNLEALLAAALLTITGQVTVQFRASLASVVLQGLLLVVMWMAGALSPAAVLATGLAGTTLMWYLTIAPCRALEAGSLPTGWLAEVLRASLPLHLASLALWLHLRVDMFMVSALDGAVGLGLYSLAVMLGETIQLATDSVGMALMANQAAGSVTDSARLGLLGARVNLVVGGVLAAAVVLAAPIGIPIVFGGEFRDAVWPLLVLLPGLVVAGAQRACGTVAIRAGRPVLLAALHTGALVVNILLNLWWIPRLGLTGAALASTCSYALSTAAILAWVVHLARADGREIVPRAADVALVWHGLIRVGRSLAGGR